MGQINHSRPQFRIIDSGKRALAAEIQKVVRPLKPGKIAIDPDALPKRSPEILAAKRAAAAAKLPKTKRAPSARSKAKSRKAMLAAARKRQKVLDQKVKDAKKAARLAAAPNASPSEVKPPRVRKQKLGKGLLNPMSGVIVEARRKPRTFAPTKQLA